MIITKSSKNIMIYLLLLSVCFLFTSDIYCQSYSLLPDEHYNPANGIKAANIEKEYIYSYTSKEKGTLDSILVAIIQYNADGKIDVWEQYDNSNNLISFTRYYYNTNG